MSKPEGRIGELIHDVARIQANLVLKILKPIGINYRERKVLTALSLELPQGGSAGDIAANLRRRRDLIEEMLESLGTQVPGDAPWLFRSAQFANTHLGLRALARAEAR